MTILKYAEKPFQQNSTFISDKTPMMLLSNDKMMISLQTPASYEKPLEAFYGWEQRNKAL